MFVVSVWRPEAASGPSVPPDPFDGTEVLALCKTEADVDRVIDQARESHPNWMFSVEAVVEGGISRGLLV